MANARQYLITHIKERLSTVSGLRTVLPWQIQFPNSEQWRPSNTNTPAVYYHFVSDEWQSDNETSDICTPRQVCVMEFQLFVCLYNKTDYTRIEEEFLTLKQKVHDSIYWKKAVSTEKNSMSRVRRISDEPIEYTENVICHTITYTCNVTEEGEIYGETETVENIENTLEYGERN